MTIRECFYLEYACAASTAALFWAWLFCLSYLNLNRVRRKAGPLLGVVRYSISNWIPVATFLSITLFLHAMTAFFYFRDSNTIVDPFAFFIICFLVFIPLYYWRRVQVAVELHDDGMVSHRFRELFMPWEAISYCRWIERYNCIEMLARRRCTTIPFRGADAGFLISIAGQFIEIRNEAGAIIHAGSKKSVVTEQRTFTPFQREPRKPFQFSILSLLFLTTVVALASGWYGVTREYDRLRRQILDPLHEFSPSCPPAGPIDCLYFNSMPQPFCDSDMPLLKPFHDLRTLGFYNCPLTDAAIPDLVSLQSLECLIIRNSGITPAGFKRLKREMPHTEINY